MMSRDHRTQLIAGGAAVLLCFSGAAFGQDKSQPAQPTQPVPAVTQPAPGVRVLDPVTAVPISTQDPNVRVALNQATQPAEVKPGTSPFAPVIGQNALPNPFKFERASYDWGDIADTAPVEYDVTFTNISSETLSFTVAASCGCTVATPEKTTLATGESSKVKAKFDPHGRQGLQTKSLTFTVTSPQAKYAQQTFNLTANVKALVTFDPPKLFLNEVDHRSGKTDKITVTGRKEGFKIEKIDSNSEFVKSTIGEASMVEVNGEKVTQIVVSLDIGKGAPIGTINSQLSFFTNDDKAKLNPVFVGADIVGDVKCTPAQAILRVNTVSTPFESDVRIDSRSGSEFKITGIEFESVRSDMNAVADVKPGPNNAYFMIKITGMTPAEPGMHTGYLVVTTDAGGGETIRVPFTAAVARPAAPGPAKASINPTPVPVAAPIGR